MKIDKVINLDFDNQEVGYLKTLADKYNYQEVLEAVEYALGFREDDGDNYYIEEFSVEISEIIKTSPYNLLALTSEDWQKWGLEEREITAIERILALMIAEKITK